MELVGRSFWLGFEAPLMEWLQSHLGTSICNIISQLSALGEEVILVFLLGLIYWSLNKKMGKYLGLNMCMTCVWNPMLKNVFIRRRPYFDHENIKLMRLIDPDADLYDISAQGYSFPSGHSTNAATFYGGLARSVKKRWMTAIAVIATILVGFSRVVVGAHYPTDVMCGWLLGIFVIIFVPWLSSKIQNRNVLYLLLLAMTLPGMIYCRSSDYYSGLGLLIGFMAGSLFEEKFVKFENTKKVMFACIRVILGLALFVGLNAVLKLPFSVEFLESGTYASLMVRCCRYAIVAFVDFGVYPMLFKWI